MSVISSSESTLDTISQSVKDTSTSAFSNDVIEASRRCLILVDFWAKWCSPCKQLTPILESVVATYVGKVKLVKLNIDEHPAIAGQLRVQSLPTVYAFRNGQLIDGFMGIQPESAIREFIDRAIEPDMKSELKGKLTQAEEALGVGNLQIAADIYATILQSEPQNPDALCGLANCYLSSGDRERARQTIALIPPEKNHLSSVKSIIATLELVEKTPFAKELGPLEARLKANPADSEARFELAIAAAANGDKKRAVDELLDLFRLDRNWNQGAARKQLLQFFDAWGPKDPHTLDGRKRLSSLMFA